MPIKLDSNNFPFVTTGNFAPYDKNRHRPAPYSNKKEAYYLKIREILKDSGLSPSLRDAIFQWAFRRDACGINLKMCPHQLAELAGCTPGTIYRQLVKAVSKGIVVLVRKGCRGRRKVSDFALGPMIPFWEDFLKPKGYRVAICPESIFSESTEGVPPTPMADKVADLPSPESFGGKEGVQNSEKPEKAQKPKAEKPPKLPQEKPKPKGNTLTTLGVHAMQLAALVVSLGLSHGAAQSVARIVQREGRAEQALETAQLAAQRIPECKDIKDPAGYTHWILKNKENCEKFKKKIQEQYSIASRYQEGLVRSGVKPIPITGNTYELALERWKALQAALPDPESPCYLEKFDEERQAFHKFVDLAESRVKYVEILENELKNKLNQAGIPEGSLVWKRAWKHWWSRKICDAIGVKA